MQLSSDHNFEQINKQLTWSSCEQSNRTKTIKVLLISVGANVKQQGQSNSDARWTNFCYQGNAMQEKNLLFSWKILFLSLRLLYSCQLILLLLIMLPGDGGVARRLVRFVPRFKWVIRIAEPGALLWNGETPIDHRSIGRVAIIILPYNL